MVECLKKNIKNLKSKKFNITTAIAFAKESTLNET